jgi:hypothetical protein
MRDAKVAEVIDAIGEISPEAKRMILSGEVKIDKKELAELSSYSVEKLSEITLAIENGTFEKARTVSSKPESSSNSSDSAPEGTQPPNPDISRIMNGFYSELQKLAKTSDAAEFRIALGSYISKLEKLYGQI